MATTTDPRAAGFDATKVRDAIKFAMNMGLPDQESERVTFHWNIDKTFDVADPGGKPYDMTSTAKTKTVQPDVLIDAAVEFVPAITRAAANTPFKSIDTPKIIVTVLDEDFASVQDADTMLFAGAVYTIEYVGPPQGLFDMTIYQFYGAAEDENR